MGADAKRKELRRQKFSVKDDVALQPKNVDTRADPDDSAMKDVFTSELNTADQQAVETPTNDAQGTSDTKKSRFICFIGNLPYTATAESISLHFQRVSPVSVRHSTLKGTTKSRGFAFLEFDNYDRMKTCLKLYHHSTFEDGTSPGRKINVELTAGGGGAKSKTRKLKLREKNAKLEEERKRQNGEGTENVVAANRPEQSDVHPSRRNLVFNR